MSNTMKRGTKYQRKQIEKSVEEAKVDEPANSGTKRSSPAVRRRGDQCLEEFRDRTQTTEHKQTQENLRKN